MLAFNVDSSKVFDLLDTILSKAQSPDLVNKIADSIVTANKTRFNQQLDPDNNRWENGSYSGLPITLKKSGTLFNSIRNQGNGLISPNLSLPYVATHQYGAFIRPKRAPALRFLGSDGTIVKAKSVIVPARPYFGLNEQDDIPPIHDLVINFLGLS